ncbi:MAG: hypothetical protein LBR78_01875 [Holosporales bacterium]|jgi:hypothetical protein|nr:hypothetical protein [Holosporales bacterium]
MGTRIKAAIADWLNPMAERFVGDGGLINGVIARAWQEIDAGEDPVAVLTNLQGELWQLEMEATTLFRQCELTTGRIEQLLVALGRAMMDHLEIRQGIDGLGIGRDNGDPMTPSEVLVDRMICEHARGKPIDEVARQLQREHHQLRQLLEDLRDVVAEYDELGTLSREAGDPEMEDMRRELETLMGLMTQWYAGGITVGKIRQQLRIEYGILTRGVFPYRWGEREARTRMWRRVAERLRAEEEAQVANE